MLRNSLILLAICCLGLPRPSEAATSVSGPVGGQTWTLANSPYRITGDVSVGLLTIEAGVTIVVEGDFVIRIGGTLQVSGTIHAPVVFRPAEGVDRWQGIRFHNNPPGSSMVHCLVQKAGVHFTDSQEVLAASILIEDSPHGGLRINGSDVIVEDSLIRNNTNGTKGGGLRATLEDENRLILRGVEFLDNGVGRSDGNAWGAGLYIEGGVTVLEDCLVSDNTCSVRDFIAGGSSTCRGGGIYLKDGALTARNSVFRSNRAQGRGSGVVAPGAPGPGRAYGGGLFLHSGSAEFVNCLFSCNETVGPQGNHGGGAYVHSGELVLTNCTVARNSKNAVFEADGNISIRNSIVFQNSGTQIQGAASVSYSCVQNGFPGTGNISFDPVFASVDGCEKTDLVVIVGSPCIDAGNPVEVFNDKCFPPSLGKVRNDMGMHGGPGAGHCDGRIPGDCDSDRRITVTDAICILGVLFLGQPDSLPCGNGSPTDPGNVALLDWQPDGAVDVSDALAILQFLFLGGPPHALAASGDEETGFVEVPGCR